MIQGRILSDKVLSSLIALGWLLFAFCALAMHATFAGTPQEATLPAPTQ